MKTIMQRISSPSLPVLLLYPFIYFLAAKLAFSFTTTPEGAVIIWIPNAVFLASLLYYKGQRYWLFALLTLLAEICGDWNFFTAPQAFCLGVSNIIEVSIAYLLMQQLKVSASMNKLSDLSKFLLAGPLISSLLGGFIGALALKLMVNDQESYLSMVRIWWFGDGLGLMLFTPLILLAMQYQKSHWRLRLSLTDWLIGGISILIAALILSVHHDLIAHFAITPVLLLPCILYFVTRTNLFWSSAMVVIISLVTAYMISRGTQLFGETVIYLEIIRTQEFIFILSAMCMGLAALLDQIRSHERDLEERVAERTHALETLNRQLNSLARTDDLTGLSNRRAFFEQAELEVARCKRYDRPLTLIMLDVDHFKSINDQHGHAIGDAVLKQIAAILRDTSRFSDIYARYGGEEFVILAAETDRESGLSLAERLRQRLHDEPTVIDGNSYSITVSMGLSFLAHQANLEKLLLEADQALYEAKAKGRNRIESTKAD